MVEFNSPLPRLLLAGVGPLPPERPVRLYAPGLRTWGMVRELARAGHGVRLVCARFDETAPGSSLLPVHIYNLAPSREPLLPQPQDLPLPAGGWPALLASEAADFGAEAAIGSTDLMNHALATADLPIPLWLDYNGDPMAERQMLALRHGSDDGLADQWAMFVPGLLRADRLSGCSPSQCAALLGQLGAVGRLNRFTASEPLVHNIPPWFELIPINIDCDPVLRGTQAPENAYLILQTGGFNTWLDVQTLFAALEPAMAADPLVHFAATGGAIPGHHASGFEWFQSAIAQSQYSQRFHLLGWLPLGKIPRIVGEADLALNIDLACPESTLGCRNRMFDWIIGTLPIISTPGCDLARELGERKLITMVPHGDPQALARAIAAAKADHPARCRLAEEASAWLRVARAPQTCLRPLLDWTAAPKPASDLRVWSSGTEAPPALLAQAREGARAAQRVQQQTKRLAWLERKLSRLEGSRLVRWALALRGRGDLDEDEPPEGL